MIETIKGLSVAAGLVGTIAVGAIYAEGSYNQQKDVEDIYKLMKSKEVVSHKKELRQLKKELRVIAAKSEKTEPERLMVMELQDEIQAVNLELKEAVK